ncbi:Testican-2 SPARC/osteonectin, CWCV, and [Collichthys lucidus]|uniref:Testican-2 SPARC/osteonectin, CWCV, and n=1 Tax=Collichthys lucidus TaxID=240159 RepID=A0A4U5VP53_COLLU|nr:Testican-2 SPARC/osteonectin, CWCV, and [Collichthys lucidus]
MVVVRIVACLSLLVGFSLQVDVKSGKEAGKAGNFMEDEQWLSTISQYSRKIKHWNRFRDVSVIIFSALCRLCSQGAGEAGLVCLRSHQQISCGNLLVAHSCDRNGKTSGERRFLVLFSLTMHVSLPEADIAGGFALRVWTAQIRFTVETEKKRRSRWRPNASHSANVSDGCTLDSWLLHSSSRKDVPFSVQEQLQTVLLRSVVKGLDVSDDDDRIKQLKPPKTTTSKTRRRIWGLMKQLSEVIQHEVSAGPLVSELVEAVDTTKDPCQNVKCSRHKVCVAQGYQRAMCVNRKKLEQRVKQSGQVEAHENSCKPCPVTASSPVCGSDGHNYASECKLEQQACLTGKDLNIMCTGFCPCAVSSVPDTNTDTKRGNLVASCKDSIGWMFSKLDTNSDLYLDQAELAAINLDKYEVCIRPFFNSCDSYKDGKVSTAEWCLCFWREKPPCLAELEKIQVQEAAKKKSAVVMRGDSVLVRKLRLRFDKSVLREAETAEICHRGCHCIFTCHSLAAIRKPVMPTYWMYIPSCDEDGYYRKVQCDQSRGECWCVDQHGGEMMGTRIHGNPDCDEVAGYSGDFGSGVGWEDEEEKEAEGQRRGGGRGGRGGGRGRRWRIHLVELSDPERGEPSHSCWPENRQGWLSPLQQKILGSDWAGMELCIILVGYVVLVQG